MFRCEHTKATTNEACPSRLRSHHFSPLRHGDNFVTRVRKYSRRLAETFVAAANGAGINPRAQVEVRDRIETMLSEHSERLGCSNENARARAAFQRSAKGNPFAQWLNVYCDLNQFRTSVPSVTVHDFAELRRRSEWRLAEYEADLCTLLKRAVGISWDEKLCKLTIRGIGKLRRVRASDFFNENDHCGRILQTKDYTKLPTLLLLYQDNETTPISDLMAEKNHIFALVRKKDVESDIDWRLPVFESGVFYLAFDGAALLLLEMARRASKRSTGE